MTIGRPAFEPTDEQRKLVRDLSGYGIRQEDIAKFLGIHHNTLRKHFRDELDKAEIEANSKVAASLFNAAINGNMTAAIFWAKTRMRWKEQPTGTDLNLNTSGNSGTPSAIVVITPVPAKANPRQPGWVPPSDPLE